jgi:hypothetical protein
MRGNRIAPPRILGIFALSLLGSLGARLFGWPQLVVPLGVPALLLSGFAFIGFLVTIDDDFPGGWSNPERSWRALLQSIALLAALFAVLSATCWAVIFWTSGRI